MRKKIVFSFISCALALCLAACGSADSESGSVPESTALAAASVAADSSKDEIALPGNVPARDEILGIWYTDCTIDGTDYTLYLMLNDDGSAEYGYSGGVIGVGTFEYTDKSSGTLTLSLHAEGDEENGVSAEGSFDVSGDADSYITLQHIDGVALVEGEEQVVFSHTLNDDSNFYSDDEASELLCDVNEVQSKLKDGMALLDTEETETIDGIECRIFALGTDSTDSFVREELYGVSVEKSVVYHYDSTTDKWEEAALN